VDLLSPQWVVTVVVQLVFVVIPSSLAEYPGQLWWGLQINVSERVVSKLQIQAMWKTGESEKKPRS
jgi:hypothetical protein